MKNVALLGLTLLVAVALVGCGGGVTKEKAAKVWDDYIKATVDAVKAKKEYKAEDLQNKAAKDNGFASWTDYATKAAQALGADEWTKLNTEKGKKLGDELVKASGAAAPAPAEGQPEEEKK